MKIKLAYGRSGLEVDFPDAGVDVIEPRFVRGLPDEIAALRGALRNPIGSRPLREIVKPADTVAIIFSDRTRPMPSDRVLPVILSELENVPRDRITLINAVGTHRHNTPEELEAMLGRRIVENFQIVQHRPKDRESMVRLGVSRFGNEVWVNREFMLAKVKILTGFIEPHFFAGFSGGPKSVLLKESFGQDDRQSKCHLGDYRGESNSSGDVGNRGPGAARFHRQRNSESTP
jgi:lactate racemase